MNHYTAKIIDGKCVIIPVVPVTQSDGEVIYFVDINTGTTAPRDTVFSTKTNACAYLLLQERQMSTAMHMRLEELDDELEQRVVSDDVFEKYIQDSINVETIRELVNIVDGNIKIVESRMLDMENPFRTKYTVVVDDDRSVRVIPVKLMSFGGTYEPMDRNEEPIAYMDIVVADTEDDALLKARDYYDGLLGNFTATLNWFEEMIERDKNEPQSSGVDDLINQLNNCIAEYEVTMNARNNQHRDYHKTVYLRTAINDEINARKSNG